MARTPTRLSDEDPGYFEESAGHFDGLVEHPQFRPDASGPSDRIATYDPNPQTDQADYLDDDLARSLQGEDPEAADPAARIQRLSERLQGAIPPPGERDRDQERLSTAIDALLDFASRRPHILDRLDRLAANPSLIHRPGFLDDVEALAVIAREHARAQDDQAEHQPHETHAPHTQDSQADGPAAALQTPHSPPPALPARIAAATRQLATLVGPADNPTALDERLAGATSTMARLAAGNEDLTQKLEEIARQGIAGDRQSDRHRQDVLERLHNAAAEHAATAEIPDERTGLTEPAAVTSTNRFTEEMELFQARPPRDQEDTRDVWVHGTGIADLDDDIPVHIQAAFDQIGASIDDMLDAATPAGFRIGDRRESVHWGLVNVFHHQVTTIEQECDKLSRQIEDLKSARAKQEKERENGPTLDGASAQASGNRPLTLEERAHELEQLTARLAALVEERDTFERQRDYAADMFFHHNGKLWTPREGTYTSKTANVPTIVVDGEYRAAMRKARTLPDIPNGTLIAVTNSRNAPSPETVIRKLNDLLEHHPDMILAHGGGNRGIPRIAAKWAQQNDVRQIQFPPDFHAHPDNIGAAIRQRDNDIAMCRPHSVVCFTAPGDRPPRLHDAALERAIPIDIVNRDVTRERHTQAATAPETRVQPRPEPSTAEKIAARHATAHRAEDIRREREHPLPEKLTVDGPIQLQNQQGRTVELLPYSPPTQPTESPRLAQTSQSAFAAENPDAYAAAKTRAHEASYGKAFLPDPPAPSTTHHSEARQATPDEQRTADKFLADPHPAAGHNQAPPDITPAQAARALVDAALPEDIALPEDAARYNGGDRQPIRDTLFSRLVGVFHSLTHGPGGTTDQLANAAERTRDLDRQNIYGELDQTQQAEQQQRSHYISDSGDALHDAFSQLASAFREETGKHWTPPAPDNQPNATRFTAAAAEATTIVEKMHREAAAARLPKGYPVAVTALDQGVDRETVFHWLDKVHAKRPDIYLAHGNAKGVLHHVSDWAKERNVKQIHFPPNYSEPANQRILNRDDRLWETVKPRGLIEFTDGTGKTNRLSTTVRAFNANASPEEKIGILRAQPVAPAKEEQVGQDAQQRSAAEAHAHGREQGKSAGMSM